MSTEPDLKQLDAELEELHIMCWWFPKEVATHYVRIVHKCLVESAGNPIQPASEAYINATEFLLMNHLEVECRQCDFKSVVEDFVEILERI